MRKYSKPRNPEGRKPIYGENKGRLSLSLTHESINRIEEIATELGISRSEVVERLVRNLEEDHKIGQKPEPAETDN
jgi:metal-responsive CopG/Arc/MetJ family transcriptional regulator